MTTRRQGLLRAAAMLLTLSSNPSASADETAEKLRTCVNEADEVRRLACYDREMGRPAATMPAGETANPASSPAPPLTAEERFGLNYEQERRKQNVEQAPDLKRLTSSITKITQRTRGELVMTLENGQIWTQNEAQSFIVKVGDPITIKAAALGSFIMSNASGRTTRVKRMQ